MEREAIPRYGVREQTSADNEVDRAIESLRLLGFAVVDGGYLDNERERFATAFDCAYQRLLDAHGGRAALEEIDEHNTIRAPLAFDEAFFALAQNPKVLAICKGLFGGEFILNQQNGIINPGDAARYNQGAYHRDLPYQHFVASRPLALNALYCIDPFTRENGATRVVPASHKEERFPSDWTVSALERTVEAAPGHFLVLDCMTYHSGGVNRTSRVRRAVNHVYTLPFIRQQIELPSLLGYDRDFPPELSKLLNYGNQAAPDVTAYLEMRRKKLRK